MPFAREGEVRRTPATHGSVVRERRLDGAVLTEATYSPGFRVARHSHDRASLMWVVSGRLVEATGTRRYPCTVTDVMWKQAGLSHENSLEERSSRVVVLELLPSMLGRLGAEGTRLPDEPARVSGPPATLFARLLPVLVETGPDEALAVQELVAAVAAAIGLQAGGRSDAPAWLRSVRERVHEAPCADDSLGDMAREAGVDPAYLSRTFRQRFGRSITEYRHARRIEFAMAALSEDEADIGRLALRLGYYDHAHFSRTFRRATGMSPSKFREVAAGRRA